MIYNFDSLSFQVLTIVYSKHTDGFYEVKKRPYAAISFKIHGSAEFEMLGKKLSVNEKDIVYLPANRDYEVQYFEPNDSVVIHLAECNYQEPECIRVSNSELTEQLFLNLLDNWDKNHSHIQAKASIFEILFKLSERNHAYKNKLFEKIEKYMSKGYSDSELDVRELCTHFGISRSYIQKLFHECIGVGPKEYLMQLRMEKVLSLLSSEEFSVKEIAALSGFADEKYLSRIFKKKYGVPPSVMKRKSVI